MESESLRDEVRFHAQTRRLELFFQYSYPDRHPERRAEPAVELQSSAVRRDLHSVGTGSYELRLLPPKIRSTSLTLRSE